MIEYPSDTQEVAPITIRAYDPSRDEAFILATWLRAYRHGSMFARRLSNDVFFPNHHPIVCSLLARSDTLVAHLDDDPNVILGYLTTEGADLLHFAYTKKSFRRMRVLSQLLEESHLPSDLDGVEVSHPTDDWHNILAGKFPGSRYNPYRGMPHGPT